MGISRGSWGKAEFSGSLKRVRKETNSRKTPEHGWGGQKKLGIGWYVEDVDPISVCSVGLKPLA